jgi:O6-methylguanine-DNA--protein-cysteine methyltransferase
VLAKDGGFGGYAWGLPVKQQLLELESAVSALKQAA